MLVMVYLWEGKSSKKVKQTKFLVSWDKFFSFPDCGWKSLKLFFLLKWAERKHQNLKNSHGTMKLWSVQTYLPITYCNSVSTAPTMYTKSQTPSHCIIMDNADLLMEKFVALQLAFGIHHRGGGLQALTLKLCSWPVSSLAQITLETFGPWETTRTPSFLTSALSLFMSWAKYSLPSRALLYHGCNNYAQVSVTPVHISNFGLLYSHFILISE